MHFTMRTLALPVVTVATALALTACGSSSAGNPGQNMPGMPGMNNSSSSASTPATSASAGPAATGPHNPADVTFAAGMIPHHQQAITMAQMALTQATNPEVKKLATAIKAAQDPEIQTMSGWLAGWGQPVPATTGATHDMSQMGSPTSDGMGGMGDMDGMGGMSGMMSDEEMSQLSSTSGAAFDKLWLQMMVKHHQGAVAMARTELTDGANTQAKQLAQSIIDSQSTEITTMTTLLTTLGS